jgi:hypothetical protein
MKVCCGCVDWPILSKSGVLGVDCHKTDKYLRRAAPAIQGPVPKVLPGTLPQHCYVSRKVLL